MASALVLSVSDREALERMARSESEPHRRVVRAGALLALADGASVRSVARVLGSHQDSVRRWRDRFLESGPAGVGAVAPGRGRKPGIAADVVDAIVDDTLHSAPEDGSAAWSTRSMAARHGVGKDTVARIWRARELRPWRTETFKLSRDPDFEAKFVDVVGLYLDPPERAAVFRWIDLHTPRHLDIHVVLDNLSAHKSEPVRAWLAHPRRKRWHLHFTPTSASWLNLIEAWFSVLTRKALAHNSFSSVAGLTDTIDIWAQNWNDNPKPFTWTRTADDIITKVKRGRAALTKTATRH